MAGQQRLASVHKRLYSTFPAFNGMSLKGDPFVMISQFKWSLNPRHSPPKSGRWRQAAAVMAPPANSRALSPLQSWAHATTITASLISTRSPESPATPYPAAPLNDGAAHECHARAHTQVHVLKMRAFKKVKSAHRPRCCRHSCGTLSWRGRRGACTALVAQRPLPPAGMACCCSCGT